MTTFILTQNLITAGIVLLMAAGAACQLTAAVYLLRMTKETQTLEEQNAKLTKPWIDTYRKEKEQISNLEAFVEKQLWEFKAGKIPLLRMKHLSGQFLLFAILLAGVGACRGIVNGQTLGQILPFYILCLFGLYIYFSLSGFIDIEDKKKIIQVNMVHFLENQAYLHTTPDLHEKMEVEAAPLTFGEKEENELKELLLEILA